MDILDFPDNMVLHLERDSRSYKVFTTEERNKFKVIYGLSDKDSIIETEYHNLREVKQILIDASVNGYSLKFNLLFKQGVMGVAKELAEEYRAKLPAEPDDSGVVA